MTCSCSCVRSLGKNLEEEFMEEINESADKCHALKTVDDFVCDDVNNCELDPPRVREARKAEMEYFHKMHVYTKVSVQEC